MDQSQTFRILYTSTITAAFRKIKGKIFKFRKNGVTIGIVTSIVRPVVPQNTSSLLLSQDQLIL